MSWNLLLCRCFWICSQNCLAALNGLAGKQSEWLFGFYPSYAASYTNRVVDGIILVDMERVVPNTPFKLRQR